ncbi:type 1 glutamine amidotransferase domain-containing protein [Microbulbifer agarilyticus]|uniref:type 1 glutamine amidotransferase domain-containing protein n=1 Tax=Microbulbifer agarilyticus TaxID=260552 RepID=UPI001C98E3ED|nr:type 1 glutamine amidotransferase domain-containing protein [Microbulbifer agarilyticus]MBY6191124.1 type 1 glutamine amidotransferase domain-containing protein [Microbulbifer agarilyticus]
MAKKLLIGAAGVALFFGLLAALLPTILHKAGLHPSYQGESVELPGKRALVITTSHGTLNAPGETAGKATGVFASEMTVPYYTFLDGGMQVDIASVQGGEIPVDPESFFYAVRTAEDERYLQDAVVQAKVKNSLRIDEVDFTQYDIIFMAGGWGAAYDLGYSDVLGRKVSEAYYDSSAVIGGVCHGVLGLIKAEDKDGKLLIAGRRMTGVSDKQIKELGIEVTPQHPETELRKAGAEYEKQTAFRDIFATHVVVDDERRFVTGQNQNSGYETAHQMMAIVAKP